MSDSAIPARNSLSDQSLSGSDEDSIRPLSYAQQRLWLIHQMEPDTPGYNLPLGLRLRGELNHAALDGSLREILKRHDVLRTCFIVQNGEPFQRIAARVEFRLGTINLSDTPKAEQEEEVRKEARAEAQRVFDLKQAPLFRATLLRLRERDHVLLITMHHIVSDGWSMGVLLGELVTLYSALRLGQPSPLTALPMQYADFAEWQRKWLTGENLERQMGYWRKELSKLPPALELPTDRPKPASRSSNGNSYRFAVSLEITEELRRLARRNKASLFMVMLAAWQVLLHRYSGQADILIGTAIANRNRLQLEELIGFFVNTLVLRGDLSGHPSFSEVLRRARETSLAAQEHQDLPFERLVAETELQQKPQDNPFFTVMFNWLNLPVSQTELAGLKWEHLEQALTANRFDLMLTVFEGKTELPGLFEYSADLFDESTVARMAGHLQTLLASIAADPEQKICDLQFLPPDEFRQLVFDWAGKETEYPRDSSLCELFERQAEQTPEAAALIAGNEKVSYRELNGKANQLARYLRNSGIRIEDPVAICLDRSAAMIIALLGVLKCGGAYVALDPGYPAERIAFVVADTKTRILITQEILAKNLPDRSVVRTLCIDRDWPAIQPSSSADLKLPLSGGNLAYIAYTSGSTGTPKGVAISHRAAIRLVRGNDYAHFGSQEIFLQFAPIAFDASTFEIWGCLLNGGTLAVCASGIEEAGKALRQQHVSTAWLTAGLFHWMTDHQPDSLRGVRQLLAGGDVLSPQHVMKFLEVAAEKTVLINGYGPTENTTFTCCQPIRRGDQFSASVPVGKPIANTRIYVLDGQMHPLPIGAAGEAFIGGDGLARGYWGQADLTGEKFVPDPYSQRPGERLYRSGDRMRWLADGRLEFLGRMDTQVKIRGFRVEPGEIEAALNAHSKVRESAVIAETQPSGEKRLLAYFSPETPDSDVTEVTAEELRQYLRMKLPDYMVPSELIAVQEFPLTANGKTDRRALSALPRGTVPGTSHAAPRTAAEKVIAQIWSEVLEKSSIGVEESFFELGGHSLQATQIILRLRETFQIDTFPLRRLFETPTVAGLVGALKEHYEPETVETIAETILEVQDLTGEKAENPIP